MIYFPLLLRFLTGNNKEIIIKDLANNLKNTESMNNDFINRISVDRYFNQWVTLGEKNGKILIIEDNLELHTNCLYNCWSR